MSCCFHCCSSLHFPCSCFLVVHIWSHESRRFARIRVTAGHALDRVGNPRIQHYQQTEPSDWSAYTARFENNFTVTSHGFERCSESSAKPGTNNKTGISGATTTTASTMRGMSHKRPWTAGTFTVLQKRSTTGSSSKKCQKRSGYHDRVQR